MSEVVNAESPSTTYVIVSSDTATATIKGLVESASESASSASSSASLASGYADTAKSYSESIGTAVSDAQSARDEAVAAKTAAETAATNAETTTSGKQDKIDDLETIRNGAALGATSLQSETDPTVSAWAKAATKPSYTYSEVGAAASSHTHTTSEISGLEGRLQILENGGGTSSYTETDPTVPAWAKATTKPTYSYTEITGLETQLLAKQPNLEEGTDYLTLTHLYSLFQPILTAGTGISISSDYKISVSLTSAEGVSV